MFKNLSLQLSENLKILQGKHKLSEKNIAEATRSIRRSLLEADVALSVVKTFTESVKNKAIGLKVGEGLTPTQAFIKLVEQELIAIMSSGDEGLNLRTQSPAVIMVAGLQGAGKTTSVAKLANHLKSTNKKKILLVSTDIYRPAAIEQLQILAEQVGVDFFASDAGQNPVDIAKNAKNKAQLQFYDTLIVDTAGRLHIDQPMMAEIKQLQSCLNPIETLFVVDSMSGQDALNSAKVFGDTLDLTGVILTKTDGDARGGVALSVKEITGKPIKFLGVGEKVDALEVFHPSRVVSRLLGMGDVLSLIEEIQQKVDHKKAQKTIAKIKKGGFNLADMREQLLQMQAMGGMASLMDKLPTAQIPPHIKNQILNDQQNKYSIAIINSMTQKERQYVQLIKGSRKQRIAKGSGTTIQQVNQTLKQFEKTKKMMGKFKGNKMKAMMQKMQNSNVVPDNLASSLKELSSAAKPPF